MVDAPGRDPRPQAAAAEIPQQVAGLDEDPKTPGGVVEATPRGSHSRLPDVVGPPAPFIIVINTALPPTPPDRNAHRAQILTAVAGICGAIAAVAVPLIGVFADDSP